MPTTPDHPLETRFEDLPATLPVFPLRSVILLPEIPLALNVFEPRYLNMMVDALAAGRVIGLIQPLRLERKHEDTPPPLASVGCVGRITSFAESGDGRLLVSLTGVCRFGMREEVAGAKGYRRVCADYAPYRSDMDIAEDPHLDFGGLQRSFAGYLRKKECAIDWDSIFGVPGALVVDYLGSHLPFSAEEKQAILEAEGHAARLELMLGFARMEASSSASPDEGARAVH